MRSVYFLFFLLFISGSKATVTPFNYPQLSINNCFLEPSKEIYNYFHNTIIPYIIDAYGAGELGEGILKETCPLHHNNYMFKNLEKYKRMNNNEEWECNSCSKKFVNEYFLEKHLITRHPELFSSESICPVKFEPLMGCASYDNCILKKCNPSNVENYKQICFNIADSCFVKPIHIDGFNESFCSHLKCLNGVYKGLYSKELTLKFRSSSTILKYIIAFLLLTSIVILCFTTNLRSFFASRSYKPSVLNRYKKKKNSNFFFNFFRDRKSD